jgi:hypothetical protein
MGLNAGERKLFLRSFAFPFHARPAKNEALLPIQGK